MCIRPLPSSYSPLPSPDATHNITETHFTSLFATILRVVSAIVGVVALIAYAATKNDMALITLGIAAACYVISWLIDPPEELPSSLPTPFRTNELANVRLSPPPTTAQSQPLLGATTLSLSPPHWPSSHLPVVPALELRRQQNDTPSPQNAMPPPLPRTPSSRRKRSETHVPLVRQTRSRSGTPIPLFNKLIPT